MSAPLTPAAKFGKCNVSSLLEEDAGTFLPIPGEVVALRGESSGVPDDRVRGCPFLRGVPFGELAFSSFKPIAASAASTVLGDD